MKILVYTGYDETPRYEHMGNASSFNKMAYCQKNNYSLLVERDYGNYTRNISWYKIYKILKLIDDYDWVCWMDADTLINNPEIRLEDLIMPHEKEKDSTYLRINEESKLVSIDKNKEKWFIASDDEWANLGPCLGGFLVKNCPEAKSFLWNVYKQNQFENHNWWDQAAAHYLWDSSKNYLDGLKVLSRVFMNSFSDFKQDCFMIHDKFKVENGKIIPKG